MLKKIGVIGGGNIGGVLVQEIARRRLSREVGLMDILEPDFAKGKCLDIAEGTPITCVDVILEGAREARVCPRPLAECLCWVRADQGSGLLWPSPAWGSRWC